MKRWTFFASSASWIEDTCFASAERKEAFTISALLCMYWSIRSIISAATKHKVTRT